MENGGRRRLLRRRKRLIGNPFPDGGSARPNTGSSLITGDFVCRWLGRLAAAHGNLRVESALHFIAALQ